MFLDPFIKLFLKDPASSHMDGPKGENGPPGPVMKYCHTLGTATGRDGHLTQWVDCSASLEFMT